MKKITLCTLVYLLFPPLSLYSQNEFLDQSFGTNGIIFQMYSDNTMDLESEFKSIVLLPDGSFLTAINFNLRGTDPRYVINRYDKNGVLDPAFGIKGFVTSSLQNNIEDVELQSDGKIIGLVWQGDFNSLSSYIFRLNPDGSIDDSFGTNGTITDPVNIIKSISVQADDRILAVKEAGSARAFVSFTAERYKPDGMPDTDFGSNGVIDFLMPQTNITLHDIISQKDGKIMISGNYGSANPDDYQRDVFFMRLKDDGNLDTTFGDEGVRSFNFLDVDDTTDVLVQSSGKTVFLCSSYGLFPSIGVVNRLVRLNEEGNLDDTFGTDGIKVIEYPILGLQSLKELENGELIAAGTYETSENPDPTNNFEPVALGIVHFKTNGDLDSNFGNKGYITSILINSRALDGKLAIQPDGKILSGATFCEAWFSCHRHTVVFRNDPSGRLVVSEFDKNHPFLIYPNPFRETLTFDFTLNQPEVLSMDLYSFDGRKVTALLKDQGFKAGFNSQKLDFSGTLAAGIYFITVSGENETKNFRIVKK
ncbi:MULTISPECIES: T9SS type A sorting domain-containing protein [Flavobacterium]|uniref:T9SS type A sorting domain-containing protein n=1 Tax=Flavobacterium TaxID=237 RepID=UPI001FCB96D4|nr:MULTISPECIES: T9SS type A sorting domain-containing protein [Flavobacterium]UOK41144.1 T9SS type A sorting domain-containing protein [Flavobacterium enshiense]